MAHVIQRCILLGFAGAGAGVNLVRFSGIDEREGGSYRSCVTSLGIYIQVEMKKRQLTAMSYDPIPNRTSQGEAKTIREGDSRSCD